MNMILLEGRKEDVYKKYQKSIDAERKFLSNYMDNASAYDFLLDDPFMIETNYKYLGDALEHHYTMNEWSGEAEPTNIETARNKLFSIRREIQGLVEDLEIFEKHKSKFKYPEFKRYLPYLQEFFQEAKKIKDEVDNKNREKLAKKGGVKIFENDSLLIVKPTTYEASCSYGAGTRWCTTMANQPSYFNQYSSNGNLYYLILKNVDRTNKFYKMAIQAPKNGRFDKDTIWYDSTDERLTNREIESVLAHMPKSAYNSMEEDFKKSFPDKKPLDILLKVLQKDDFYTIINGRIVDYSYQYKNGIVKVTFGNLHIIDFSDNMINLELDFSINDNSMGYEESGTIFMKIQSQPIQTVSEKHAFRIDVDIVPNSEEGGEIIIRDRFVVPMFIEEGLKLNETRLMYMLSDTLNEVGRTFYNRIVNKLQTDERLLNFFPPKKAKGYTMSNYTFTGKGTLTKAFMEYLKNIPEGKVGNKNEFLTQMGRRTGPGQYSSFFSALAQAGITARQGKSGLVKGINFDKFYKKVFE